MELEFSVKIDSRALYDYLLQHNYNGVGGILGTIVGALLIVAAVQKGAVIYLIAGIVLIAYLPYTLYIKARKQALTNPAFREPLRYKMTEEGVSVSQGETEQFQAWTDMVKAVSTGRSLILYTSKVNACIFPRKDLGDLTQDVIRMISTHMPPSKVKIRG